MPSTAQSSVADTVPDSTASLPTTDGSQMRHAAWLRDLEGAQHLFDADVAYFLTTASAINSQSKTVVMTAEHSRLLTTGQVELKNYSVLKPPPIADHFRGLYTSLHDSIVAGTAAPLLTLDDFPARPPQIPSHHLISPDRIIQIDMKLRNNLLALITSRGRRRHYQDLTRSGCELLRIIAADAKASASVYVQSPHIRKLKAQLEVMKKMTMTKISMVEFDAIRDGIEEINDQLEAGDRMTDVQLCDHYIGLLQKLNSHGVRLALEIKLTNNRVNYGDVEQTIVAITQVLTSFLIGDEIASISNDADGRLLTLAETSEGPPKDPAKTAIVPKDPCKFCGRMHFHRNCFKNPKADAETQKKAAPIAPSSPAALAYKKKFPSKEDQSSSAKKSFDAAQKVVKDDEPEEAQLLWLARLTTTSSLAMT